MVADTSSVDRDGALLTITQSREFLNSVATGLLLHGADGAIARSNRAATELLGATYEQLSGRTLFNPGWGAVHEDGSPFPAEERPVMQTLFSGEASAGVIVGIDNPGRARRWLSVSTYPVVVDGHVKGAVSSFVDVSDRQRKEHGLQLLTEVNRIVMFASDEVDPLQNLCNALVEYGPYALAWIGTASDDDEFTIDISYAAGVTDYLFEGMTSWSEEKDSGLGPVGTAMRTGVTQVVNDLPNDSLFEPWRERAATFGLTSVVAIPCTPEGRRLTLNVYDRHIFAFDETTVQGLEMIARESEFGVARLRSAQQVAAALDGTLAALGQMTESRDPYTEGHQVYVGLLGAAIATHLGLEARMVKLIRQSGEVHDIGKIAIPAEILTRPGKLTALEFEMLKSHTTVGSDILSKASLPWPIAEVAEQHHERLNGSGYPHGLVADEINLPSRIIAVSDVVEAMTHHRPYRSALGLDKALAEVTAGAGTLYDAQVVESCLAVFEAGFTFESSHLFLDGRDARGPR